MIFISLAISLLATLIIEVPIAYWQKIPWKLAMLVNLLTNPVVVITYHWAIRYHFEVIFVVMLLEILVVVVEGYFYRNNHSHPWRFSFCANALSFGIGLLL